jgi:hypothetical protein
VIADNGYQGAGPTFEVPQQRRRRDPDTGRYRRLSRNQKDVNAAHAGQRGPGERVNAVLKSWKILRKIRSCPTRATNWATLSRSSSSPAESSGKGCETREQLAWGWLAGSAA